LVWQFLNTFWCRDMIEMLGDCCAKCALLTCFQWSVIYQSNLITSDQQQWYCPPHWCAHKPPTIIAHELRFLVCPDEKSLPGRSDIQFPVQIVFTPAGRSFSSKVNGKSFSGFVELGKAMGPNLEIQDLWYYSLHYPPIILRGVHPWKKKGYYRFTGHKEEGTSICLIVSTEVISSQFISGFQKWPPTATIMGLYNI